MSSYTYESRNTHCICFNCNKNRLIDEDCSCGAPTMRVQSKRNLRNELQEELFDPHMEEEQYINVTDQLTDYDRIIDKLFGDIQKLKKEVKDLHTELEYYRGVAEHLGAEKAVSQKDKMIEEFHQIEQILGKALDYPWYKDDPKNFPNATEADGVCVAPNTAASLAMHAADKIKMLEIRELDKKDLIEEQREEIARLKESVEYYSDMMSHYME